MRNKPFKMMIADDDKDDREFFQFLFDRSEKFSIIGNYDSAAAALDQIITKQNMPHLLILDLYMPVMNGEEALQTLLAHPEAKELHIFIVSGTINPELEAQYAAMPNVKFLKKPASLKEKNDLPGIILEQLNEVDDRRV